MPIKTWLVPAQNGIAQEEDLNRFLAGHGIVHRRQELVHDGANSFWAVWIEYRDHRSQSNGSGASVDYKELLPPEQFEVYSRLREIRKKCAEAKGIPVYSIFTNEQLAWLAARPVLDKAAFSGIPNAPAKRVAEWAEPFLVALNTAAISYKGTAQV